MTDTISDRYEIHYYGCTVCQQFHRKGEPLYPEHLYYQDKHGIRRTTEPLLNPDPPVRVIHGTATPVYRPEEGTE